MIWGTDFWYSSFLRQYKTDLYSTGGNTQPAYDVETTLDVVCWLGSYVTTNVTASVDLFYPPVCFSLANSLGKDYCSYFEIFGSNFQRRSPGAFAICYHHQHLRGIISDATFLAKQLSFRCFQCQIRSRTSCSVVFRGKIKV